MAKSKTEVVATPEVEVAVVEQVVEIPAVEPVVETPTTPEPEALDKDMVAEMLGALQALRIKEANKGKGRIVNVEKAAKIAVANTKIEALAKMVELSDTDKRLLLNTMVPETAKAGKLDRVYYDRYNAQGGNNGDNFAVVMREAFTIRSATGAESVNLPKLINWARQNGMGAKVDIYIATKKNPGMIRMNVGNMARSMIRNGRKLVIDGKTLTIHDLAKS